MSTEPPMYIAEPTAQLEKSVIDEPEENAILAAQKAVVEHAKSPSFRDKITAEIQGLANLIISVENDFATIERGIAEIDALKKLKKSYLPLWQTQHNEYTSLMIGSRASAVEINYKITSLLNVVLPIVESDEYSLTQKRGSLTSWIQSLAKFQDDASTMQARFERLKQGVDNVRHQLRNETQRNKLVDDKVNHLEEKITNLRKELEQSKEFFFRAWDVCKRTVPTFSVAGGTTCIAAGAHHAVKAVRTAASVSCVEGTFVSGIGTAAAESGMLAMVPVASWALLVLGCAGYGYALGSAISEHRADIKAKGEAIDQLSEEMRRIIVSQSDFQKIAGKLQSLDPEFNRIISQVSTIHEIWNLLAVDAQTLKASLTELEGTDDPLLFMHGVNQLRALYDTLHFILEQYSLQVSMSGVCPE